MSYIIYTSSGTVLTTVATGKVNTSTTSLTLVGRDLLNYGRAWNQNLVYLLSNFASPNNKSPKNPILGQTWYDSTSKRFKVYKGSSFEAVGGVEIDNTEPVGQFPGEFWYDPESKNLNFLTDEDQYITLTSFPITDQSGWKYPLTPIYDTNTNTRHLTLLKSSGEVVGALSREDFIVGKDDSTSTFSRAGTDSFVIVNGLTLVDDLRFSNGFVTGDLTVGGTVTAQKLIVEFTTVTTQIVTTDDIIKTSNVSNAVSTTTGALQVAGGAGFGKDLWIGGKVRIIQTLNVGGTTTVSGSIVPTATGVYDLGTPSNRFGTLYISSSTIDFGNSAIISSFGNQIIIDNLVSTNSLLSNLTAANFTATTAKIVNGLQVGGEITATNATVTNNLRVNGVATATNLTVTNNLKVNGAITTTNLTVTGVASIPVLSGFTATNVTITGNLNVAGHTTVGPLVSSAFTATTAIVTGNLTVSGYTSAGPLVATSFTATTARVTGNLNVGGAIYSTGNITAFYGAPSDSRFKENVRNIESALAKVKEINGVTFDWTQEFLDNEYKKSGLNLKKHDLGVIAQEVEAVVPEVVDTRDDGFKFVKYEKLAGLLIEAIKELDTKLEDIKKQIGI